MVLLGLALALAAALAVGFALGRFTHPAQRRCRELEGELAALKGRFDGYKEEVGQHFARTSELVHGLTLQYRAVYDHLADGARSLCPDHPLLLSRGVEAALLAEPGERTVQGAHEVASGVAEAPAEEPAPAAETVPSG
jgi:uncharacterized membrane-anchored protein YhcB (DUF1043 family)